MFCQSTYKRWVNGMPQEWPCGKCPPCRINQARQWQARIMLEAQDHARSSFVTLTYSDAMYPRDGNLSRRELQLFLKRFRKLHGPVRYFAVGEYGDKTGRAHYHAVLFGVGLEAESLVAKAWSVRGELGDYDFDRRTVKAITEWQKYHGLESRLPIGWTSVSELLPERAGYVAQYTVKKLGGKRTDGKVEEFALQSRKPGIGAATAFRIGSRLRYLRDLEDGETSQVDDVRASPSGEIGVSTFRIGGRRYPLGRYIKSIIDEELGGDERTVEEKARYLGTLYAENSTPEAREKVLESGRRAAKALRRASKAVL